MDHPELTDWQFSFLSENLEKVAQPGFNFISCRLLIMFLMISKSDSCLECPVPPGSPFHSNWCSQLLQHLDIPYATVWPWMFTFFSSEACPARQQFCPGSITPGLPAGAPSIQIGWQPPAIWFLVNILCLWGPKWWGFRPSSACEYNRNYFPRVGPKLVVQSVHLHLWCPNE